MGIGGFVSHPTSRRRKNSCSRLIGSNVRENKEPWALLGFVFVFHTARWDRIAIREDSARETASGYARGIAGHVSGDSRKNPNLYLLGPGRMRSPPAKKAADEQTSFRVFCAFLAEQSAPFRSSTCEQLHTCFVPLLCHVLRSSNWKHSYEHASSHKDMIARWLANDRFAFA